MNPSREPIEAALNRLVAFAKVNKEEGAIKDVESLRARVQELEKDKGATFKIMSYGYKGVPDSIPFEWVKPFGNAAQRNHSQSLERLNERGGLDPTELLAVVENRRWHPIEPAEAAKQLLAWIEPHKEQDHSAEVQKCFDEFVGNDEAHNTENLVTMKSELKQLANNLLAAAGVAERVK